jgi:hypothetical protein
MTAFKKLLPYFLTSIVVIGLWRLFTLTDNYAWTPKGKERLMLDIALTTIFIYKTVFWLIIANLAVFIIKCTLKNKYKATIVGVFIGVTFYVIGGRVVGKSCAFSYYTVFINQSVAEGYLQDPIKEAGYYIGPILTEEIKDKQMKLRRYAIGGLGDINYKPATETLKVILIDKTEPDYLRADAFVTLQKFGTNTSNKILADFRKVASDTVDKKVINLVDDWGKSN